MTATQSTLLKHNWSALAHLQAAMLTQDHVSLEGYKLVGFWQHQKVVVLYGRTAKLWVHTIVSPEMTAMVAGPIDAVRGESLS